MQTYCKLPKELLTFKFKHHQNPTQTCLRLSEAAS